MPRPLWTIFIFYATRKKRFCLDKGWFNDFNCIIRILKYRCARVSLSKIDREKNSLDRERIFFPVKFIFPCQMTFFPVNIFFPCQVLTFFPCQFLINSSKITTIKSSPCRLRDKSNTSIMCKKI